MYSTTCLLYILLLSISFSFFGVLYQFAHSVLQLTVAGYHWLGSNQGLGEVNKWWVVTVSVSIYSHSFVGKYGPSL